MSGSKSSWRSWTLPSKLRLLGRLQREAWLREVVAIDNLGQLAPDEWGVSARIWYAQGGRGSGKTRAGAETLGDIILNNPPGDYACVGPTFGDARDTMIEHRKSGLKKILGPAVRQWNRSLGELYVANGSVVYCDGADDGALRIQGKELRAAWADEIGLWKATRTKKGEIKGGEQAWKESLIFAVRESPALILATGTPKGNRGVVRLLRKEPAGRVVFTRPSLAKNRVNLEPEIVAEWEELYKGTRLGRQELLGEVLEDVEGALWTMQLIEDQRWDVALEDLLGTMGVRTVVAVDPATTSNPDSDETGIIAACRIPIDADLLRGIVAAAPTEIGDMAQLYDHGFILADRSGIYTPTGWAKAAVGLYHELNADRIVGEANQGGDMVRTIVLQVDPNVNYEHVWASKSKEARAEPKAGLYEQGRIHHREVFEQLEDEQATWVPGQSESPNRLDAAVWALEDLFPSSPTAATLVAGMADTEGVPIVPSPVDGIMKANW